MKTENIKLPLITNTFTMYNSFLSEITYFHGKQQCHTGDHANVLPNDLHLESEGEFSYSYSTGKYNTNTSFTYVFHFINCTQ